MRSRLLAGALAALAFALGAHAAGAASAPGGTPIVSDIRPYSFAVSWGTATPSNASLQVQINGAWQQVHDALGSGSSVTHFFAVPCNAQSAGCTHLLKANTTYAVRASGAGIHTVTLHVRTTGLLPPSAPATVVGGHVHAAGGQPLGGALVYVTVLHGKEASVPLATVTLGNGGWLVALGNAVTKAGKQFPVSGDRVRIQIVSGTHSAQLTRKLHGMAPLLLPALTLR